MITITVIIAISVLIYATHTTHSISKVPFYGSLVETASSTTTVKMVLTFSSPSTPLESGYLYVSLSNVAGSDVGPYYVTPLPDAHPVQSGATITVTIAGDAATILYLNITNLDGSIGPSGSTSITAGFTGSWSGTSISMTDSGLVGTISTTL
jgi:hypothetical protein